MNTPDHLLNRRELLRGVAAGVIAAGAGCITAGAAAPAGLTLLGAYGDGNGGFGLAGIGGEPLRLQTRLPLPARAHDAALHPQGRSGVVVARRPGAFMLRFARGADGSLTALQHIDAAPGRHFYGHAVFDAAGERLFATENDYDNERGEIGVYRTDAATPNADGALVRAGAWSSGGIGPHQLILLPGGDALAVANGGIITHPDSGRAKLNLDTMRPSLVKLSATDGRVLDEARLPDDQRRLSIRHIAATPTCDVVFGLQNEGPPDPRQPLVGVWRSSGEVKLFAPFTEFRQGYIGSVAVDASGRIAAATAPRDGQVTFWSIADGKLLAALPLDDGCGVAPTARAAGFFLSNGIGELYDVSIDNGSEPRIVSAGRAAVQWDNHLLAV